MKDDASKLSENDPGWERDLIARLASAALIEQRRARRWGIFFKLVALIYLFGLLMMFGHVDFAAPQLSGRHTALVDVSGLILDGEEAGADNVITALRAAYEDTNTAGIIIRINSPGGSPVQAGYIYDEMKRLRAKYSKIPLYAVVADVCASGGMYVAAAADKIFANKASIVGSIGVRLDSFGFVKAIDKLGVERRLLTAGESKGLLDPFLPLDPAEVSHMQGLLNEVHRQFIEVVKRGRGDRLANDERLFTGLVWTGEQAIELGLVDAQGSAGYVAREVIGEERIVDFTLQRTWLDRFSERIAYSFGSMLRERVSVPMLR